MNRRIKLYENQRGIVSIIVTIIIMFVLSITVMSFATVMRREQRQVLDRQLNTQAFYAAESGINDVIAKLKELSLNDPGNILQNSYTSNCTEFESKFPPDTLKKDVSGDNNVAYTCLLVDPRPETLEYKSVDRNPLVIPVKSGSGNLDTIIVNWQATDGSADFNCPGSGTLGPPDLSPNSQWVCTTGLLRVDLVQTAATFTRDALNSGLRTLFLYPRASGAGTYTWSGADTGHIVEASCTATPPPGVKYCTATINVPPAQNYYMRLSSIYRSSAVTISARSGASPVQLVGAQAMIDSTGRANDILRRIQVRVSINPLGNGPFPIGAIQSVNSLCKQFSVVPPTNSVTSPGDLECSIN